MSLSCRKVKSIPFSRSDGGILKLSNTLWLSRTENIGRLANIGYWLVVANFNEPEILKSCALA